jgi:hypothetical protein
VNPARVKALEAFEGFKQRQSAGTRDGGVTSPGTEIAVTEAPDHVVGSRYVSDEMLEEEMEKVVSVLRKVPSTGKEEAEFDFLLHAGVLLATADGPMERREKNFLCNVLSEYMFWPPGHLEGAGEDYARAKRVAAKAGAFLAENHPQRVRDLFRTLVRLMLRDNTFDQRELDVLYRVAGKPLGLSKGEMRDIVLDLVEGLFNPAA